MDNSNIYEYVKVFDSNEELVKLYVDKENDYYLISSSEYVAGESYIVEVNETVKLIDRKDNKLYFIVEKENTNNIKYKENVIVLNKKDIVNYYTSNDKTYIYTKNELFNKDNPYVLVDESGNLLGTYKIINVSVQNDYYVYECNTPNYEDVFEAFEIYYSGDVDIEAEYISYELEEEITREFKKSPLYKQFNDAVDEFMKLETSKKYNVSKDSFKPKFSINNGALIISIELKATFSENNDEYLNIVLRVENRIEIDADISAQLFSPKFSGVIDTNNYFSVS